VDGSTSNELQTLDVTGTTTATLDLSSDASDASITGAGISAISVVGNAITVTSTEVDGSTSNEIQAITASGTTTTYGIDLSVGGGTVNLIEGTNITIDRTSNDLTINASGGTPGGSNTQVQYNNAGAFGGITGATTDGTTLTLVAPILGTPASGNFSSGTFTWPTFNQNTSGSAATLTTTRTLWGQNFNGSADVTGSLTAVGSITGGASSMTVTSGTGASRTLTLQTTTAGSSATDALILSNTQGLRLPAYTTTSGLFYGDATGNVLQDAQLTWDATNDELTLGSLVIGEGRPSSGTQNIGMGTGGVLNDLGAGANNIAIGHAVFDVLTTGNGNIGIGVNAGGTIDISDNYNIFIGELAGDTRTDGDQNVHLGYNTQTSSTTGNGELSIQNAIYGVSNTGTGVTESTGNIGIYMKTPTYNLQVRAPAANDDIFLVEEDAGNDIFIIEENAAVSTITIAAELSAGGGVGTSGQFLKSNGAGVAPSWVTASGTGDLLSSNNLSDVANVTTSRNNILPSKTGNSLKVLRVNAGETDYELATISGAHTIKEEGSGLTARTGLNFVGSGITATDDSGNDETDVTLDSDLNTIAGLTATTDNFLVSVSSAWASRTPAQVRTTLGLIETITFTIGEGTAITTGGKTRTRVMSPVTGTITGWKLIADQSCTATLDIWKDTVIPDNADSITASAKPSTTAVEFNSSTTLTGWTTSVTAGDILMMEVESNNNALHLSLQLTIQL